MRSSLPIAAYICASIVAHQSAAQTASPIDGHAELRVRASLSQSVSLDLKDADVDSALATFKSVIKTEIFVEEDVIEREYNKNNWKVSLRLEDAPVSAALDAVLKQLQLDWTIHKGKLWITTPDQLADREEFYVRRIYDVTDLVGFREVEGEQVADFTHLIAAVRTANGELYGSDSSKSPTKVVPLQADGVSALVVTQLPRVHDQIANALETLRAARRDDAPQLPRFRLRRDQFSSAPPAGNGASVVTRESASHAGDVFHLADGCNQFGCRLYRELATTEKGNFVVSPLSQATLLAMFSTAADSEAYQEMAGILEIDIPKSVLPRAFADLRRAIVPTDDEADPPLTSANAMWYRAEGKVIDSVNKDLTKHFGAELFPADFADTKSLAASIDDWARKQVKLPQLTFYQPEELVSDGVWYVDVVLLNAMRLFVQWKFPFDSQQTAPAVFHAPAGEVDVEMMEQFRHFRFAHQVDASIIELPHMGDRFDTFVILPTDPEADIAKFEQSLKLATINAWIAALKYEMVHLWLPRFQIESRFEMDSPLQKLGMNLAFLTDQPPFRFLDPPLRRNILYKPRQHATIIVNEIGVEATAVSGGMGGGGFGQQPIEFRANRPFLFMVRERETRSILFIGRVLDPTAGEST